MGRFLPLVLLLLLAGCYSDQKQHVSACELQAKQHTNANDDAASSEYIELCMRAQGYEVVQDDCPSYLQTDTVPKVDPASVRRSERFEQIPRNGSVKQILNSQSLASARQLPKPWIRRMAGYGTGRDASRTRRLLKRPYQGNGISLEACCKTNSTCDASSPSFHRIPFIRSLRL